MIYSVYGRWDNGAPIPATVVELINADFQPGDEGVCAWVEPIEPNVLRVSLDIEAMSDGDALRLGHAALAEAAVIGSLSGRPTEVVAMTEEGQSAWSE